MLAGGARGRRVRRNRFEEGRSFVVLDGVLYGGQVQAPGGVAMPMPSWNGAFA